MATELEISNARAVLAAKWNDCGECSSCGWHAALYEHAIDDDDIAYALDKEGGVLMLSCLSGGEDGSSHRGALIYIGPHQ